MCVESLKCDGVEGPSKMRRLVQNTRLPRRLPGHAYRILWPLFESDDLKASQRTQRTEGGGGDKNGAKLSPPPVVRNKFGEQHTGEHSCYRPLLGT